jgi:hypothetical protein
MSQVLGDRFERALVYAHVVHAAQRRKGTDVPYIAHLLAVAGLVIEDAAATGQLSEDEVMPRSSTTPLETRAARRPSPTSADASGSGSPTSSPRAATPWRRPNRRGASVN